VRDVVAIVLGGIGYDVHTLDELKTRWQICGTRDRRVLIEVSLAPEVILSPCH
jgi:hypothetical protein